MNDVSNLNDEQKLLYEMNMAIYLESVIREGSFLPIILDIDGIPVKQYTMMHHILLDFSNSPFVKGIPEYDKEHVWDFIWAISTEFVSNEINKKREFIAKYLPTRNTDESINKLGYEIIEYLTNAFIDAGEECEMKRGGETPTTSWVADYVSLIASTYGWTDEYILHLPLNRVCQYIRCITKQEAIKNGSKADLSNRLSGPAIKRWMGFLADKSKPDGGVVMVGDNVIVDDKG